MEDPQLTSKVVPLKMKQALLVELGFVRDAACTTCDLLLITKSDLSPSLGNISSSEEELESLSDEDDESLSSVEAVTGCVSQGLLGWSFEHPSFIVGANICKSCRSASVIGGDVKFGSGKGCLAPLAWEVMSPSRANVNQNIPLQKETRPTRHLGSKVGLNSCGGLVWLFVQHWC